MHHRFRHCLAGYSLPCTEFVFCPMEHLTVNLRLMPEIFPSVGCVHSIEYHGRLIQHVAYSARGIHPLITVRHISLIGLVDGMAACPRITKRHGEIIKRVHRKNGMPYNLKRIDCISILCKFPIVVGQLIVANVCEQLVHNAAHLLSVVSVNVRRHFIKLTCGRLVNVLVRMNGTD